MRSHTRCIGVISRGLTLVTHYSPHSQVSRSAHLPISTSTMAEPRPSTDQESAPLLAGAGHDHDDDDEPQRKAFLGIYDASRPLTALERVLAVTALLLLLVSGTFIGLFAGTEHTLKKERKHHDNSPDHPTVTATTTEVTTTTVPVPGPTGGVPSKVSSRCTQ